MYMSKELSTRPNGEEEELRHFKDPAVEAWANASEKPITYPKGEGVYVDGTSYNYPPGKILMIKGEQAMATCESPWSQETARKVFETFEERDVPIRVLEFGWGMGITAEALLQQLSERGKGEYHGVELNRGVYSYANNVWRPRWVEHNKTAPEPEPKVRISLTLGEASQEAKRLAERGEKYRIIISDTYPIKEEERGINDLLFLDDIAKLLTKDGVFAFYPYFPAAKPGQLTAEQTKLLERHFKAINVDRGPEVKPSKEYMYLQTEEGAVRWLPIAIAAGPIAQDA